MMAGCWKLASAVADLLISLPLVVPLSLGATMVRYQLPTATRLLGGCRGAGIRLGLFRPSSTCLRPLTDRTLIFAGAWAVTAASRGPVGASTMSPSSIVCQYQLQPQRRCQAVAILFLCRR